MIILKLTENAIILSAGIAYFEAPRLSPEILVRTFSMYTYSEVVPSRSICALPCFLTVLSFLAWLRVRPESIRVQLMSDQVVLLVLAKAV